MRILIFGDSITEGYYDCVGGGWANLLKMDLLKNYENLECGISGISGNETVDIIERIDFTTKSYIEKYNSEVTFIFAIGINDSVTNIDETKFAYKTGTFQNNLLELISKAKKYNPKDIYFIGLSNVNEKLTSPFPWSNNGVSCKNNRIREFDNIIKETSLDNDCKYIEIFYLLNNSDLSDGLHPNRSGHKKMYNKIKSNLEFIK